MSEKGKAWRKSNPEGWQKVHDRHRRKLRNSALDAYGAWCHCCGEVHREFLAIDHINGGGCEHRRQLGNLNSTQFYRWLRNEGYPAGFRVLCHNCNMSLGAYGYCPHEEE